MQIEKEFSKFMSQSLELFLMVIFKFKKAIPTKTSFWLNDNFLCNHIHRYAAYRQLFWWVHAYLGNGVRTSIPLGIVARS